MIRAREPGARVDRIAYATIGAAIEVHRLLGPGLLENVYEEAFRAELDLRGIPFARQVATPMFYKGRCLGELRLDLIVAQELVVELKAVDALSKVHWAQLLSYLKASHLGLGLLINFNVPELRDGIKRLVLNR